MKSIEEPKLQSEAFFKQWKLL